MDLLPLQFTAPAVVRSTDSTRPVQSVTLAGHGGINKIKVRETPLQEIVPDDHVEVEVHYCGLNFTDNYLRLGIIRNRNFPVIMGSECSGVVTSVGNNVTGLQVGQRVLCLQMQGGLFRNFVHVHRKYCFLLPDDISVKDAVALGLHFVVAHFCLHEFGWFEDCGTVFMQSIGGGVGTALVQLARTLDNVEVLGTASESKHEKLQSLGVKRVFRHHENYEEEILKDHPEGADIVVNTNGGSDIGKCLRTLKPVGRLLLLGSNSTATYPKSTSWGIARPKWDSGRLSSAEIVKRNFCVVGVNIGVWLDLHPETVQQSLGEIFKLYSSGKIKPCIHAVLPFDQVAEGITLLCKRENFGKVILEVKMEGPEAPPVEVQTSAEQEPEPQPEAVAKEEPKGKAQPDVLEAAAEAPAVKMEEAADPKPEVEQPKQKGDPDEPKGDTASSVEPKAAEPSHCKEVEEVPKVETTVSAP